MKKTLFLLALIVLAAALAPAAQSQITPAAALERDPRTDYDRRRNQPPRKTGPEHSRARAAPWRREIPAGVPPDRPRRPQGGGRGGRDRRGLPRRAARAPGPEPDGAARGAGPGRAGRRPGGRAPAVPRLARGQARGRARSQARSEAGGPAAGDHRRCHVAGLREPVQRRVQHLQFHDARLPGAGLVRDVPG